MKSILISIQPQFVEKILNGEKTIEIRKTKPSCELPCKVYIYQTKKSFVYKILKWLGLYKGKVVAEFTLDAVEEFYVFDNGSVQGWNWFGLNRSCLTYEQISEYIGLDKKGYAWHIDDLVVYDKPKELSEFYTLKKCNSCASGYESSGCRYDEDCKIPVQVTRPPQSYMFVEELGEDYE